MVGKGRKKVEINLIKDTSSRMAEKLYCSDTKIMDSLICPQVDNSSEIQRENDLDTSFVKVRAVDSLPCIKFGMPLKNALNSSFVGGMAEESFSSDVPTPNSVLWPQLKISIVNDTIDGWKYAFPEAVDRNFYYSDAASLNPLLYPQFNISTVQEEDNFWEFDFAKTIAGKEMLFWFNRTNVQAMRLRLEELRQLERAIWDYGQLQFSKNYYR